MSRQGFSRVLLLFLAAAVVVVVVFRASTGGEPEALVAFGTDLEPGEFWHRAFVVEQPVRLAVHAVGSFEMRAEGVPDALAAYGWIVRRAEGEDSARVVWQMQPRYPERGTLAVHNDSLDLAPGTYDAYFTALGDPLRRSPPPASFGDRAVAFFSRDGQAWHGDAEHWRFRLTAAPGAEAAARELERHEEGFEPTDDGGNVVQTASLVPGLVWASGPVFSNSTRTFLFEVSRRAAVRVRATGEIVGGRPLDAARIERLGGEVVWAMTAANTRPAGGSAKNRRVDTLLTLAPGVYRAVFQTDESHAWASWQANPPLFPDQWGLSLHSASADAIAALDPWARLPRLAELVCVGDNALEETSFTLLDSTDVLVQATGEVVGDSRYDYAWLTREPAPGAPPETVWDMDASRTTPAGGADKNRFEEAALTLIPGTYVLHYTTDGSHACGSFNSEGPPDPNRWGATVFALDPDFDPARVQRPGDVTDRIRQNAEAIVGTTAPGPYLARLVRLGDDTLATATFALDAPGRVRVYAVGEILPSGALDFGELRDASGAVVWQMTRANTRAAGGSAKNRVADTLLALPAGRYEARFQTDEAHAFGAFTQAPPRNPTFWGMTVERVGG